MQGGADLIIGQGAEWHEYYLNADDQAGNLIHGIRAVNAPMNSSGGTPTQAGGVWDVRDTEGDKSIAHLDWQYGAGQSSLDAENSVAGKFHSSEGFDIHRRGELSLLNVKADTHRDNVTGPIFSALGYLWLGQAEPSSTGLLKYSTDDGATWSNATINGTVPTSSITDFTTDGTHVYFCVPAGAETGVWRNNVDSGGSTVVDPANFRKLSAAGSTNKIFKIAYQSGIIFCATTTNAGLLKVSDNTYDAVTPAFLNAENTTAALAAAGNAVYWVVSQGGSSFVYEIAYDPDLQTATTKQLSELTGGFVSTCAIGYLGNLYIGGYLQSTESSVGRGGVFICNTDSGEVQPLVEIGDYPEDTQDPDSIANDNRVYALCASSRDLYILSNFDCWRWDLDGGGYSHVFNHTGSGAAALVTSFNAGSNFSWDGTDQYVVTTHESSFPNGWTVDGDATPEHDDEGTKWSFTGGVATYKATNTVPSYWTGVPSGGEALSNSTGTTIRYHGATDRAGVLTFYIDDGTKRAIFGVGPSTLYLYRYGYPEHLGYYDEEYEQEGEYFWRTVYGWHQEWSGTQYWSSGAFPDNYRVSPLYSTLSYSNGSAATEVYFHLHGNTAEIWNVNQTVIQSTTSISPTVSTGLQIHWPPGSNINLYELNSLGYTPSLSSSEYLFHPSITFHKGRPWAAYSDPSTATSLTINNISVASPTNITTTTNHGISTGQVVNITGTTTTTSPVGGINGNYVATYVDADTFSIPVNVTSGGTVGTVKYNHSVGYTTTGTNRVTDAWLKTSHTTFHSGSMLKKFKYTDVGHDALPTGSTVSVASIIDGTSYQREAVTTGTMTRVPLNKTGYGIETVISIYVPASTTNYKVKSFNVIWDFARAKVHTYSLDCRPGVANGRWKEDPEAALAFLFDCAQGTAQFEDRFNGLYDGVIDAIEYKQAPRSLTEPANGTVKIQVREVQ